MTLRRQAAFYVPERPGPSSRTPTCGTEGGSDCWGGGGKENYYLGVNKFEKQMQENSIFTPPPIIT